MKKPHKKDLEEFILESNAIEGEHSIEAFEDAMAAWECAQSFRRITAEDVLEIHRVLMSRVFPEIAGRVRDVAVRIGGRLKPAVPTALILEEVEELCGKIMMDIYVGKSLTEVSKNSMTKIDHVRFEEIHPFQDGNGRVGRIIYNWQRLRMGLPLHIIHVGDEQKEYYTWFRVFEKPNTQHE